MGRKNAKVAPVQQNQMVQNMEMLEEAKALEEKTNILRQEANNKTHDTEFSQYSEVNGTPEQMDQLNNITEADVKKATEILLKYKEGKKNLEQKIIDNEEFWKMNHWDIVMDGKEDDQRIRPKSGWLLNTIINKHADAMDNFPEANILPRTRDDEETAKVLSSVIPVILEQNDYEQTYSDKTWYKCKNGTGVEGVFWNNDKHNGLGDVEIKKIDIMNLYWKPGITDIQESPNVFHVSLMDNEEIKARYPEIRVGTGMLTLAPEEYRYDDKVDTAEQTPVIDWYYKKRIKGMDIDGIPQTKTLLHYCKFCNGQVIYASENDPNYVDNGWYNHGLYPFVMDVLFPVEGSICGMGYIDVIKDDQIYIDKLQQAILENAAANARPRYAVREDAGLNETEFADLSAAIVHFSGNMGEDAFRQINATPLSGIYENVYLNKVSELKDTSGNTASSQGQASAVTSASGIASLQEAAGKLSRDANTTSYRAYKQVVYLVIELIRQFYDEPRCFRIAGEQESYEFVEFDNSGLLPQGQGNALGIDLGNRLPVMDIEVKPQKRSAYSKESQNQTALQLYGMGFFNPQNGEASLACLEMMEFDGIEKARKSVKNNLTLYQMVMQLQQQVMQMGQLIDLQNGTNITGQAEGNAQMVANTNQVENKGGTGKVSKGSLSSQAATATRTSTAPR